MAKRAGESRTRSSLDGVATVGAPWEKFTELDLLRDGLFAHRLQFIPAGDVRM